MTTPMADLIPHPMLPGTIQCLTQRQRPWNIRSLRCERKLLQIDENNDIYKRKKAYIPEKNESVLAALPREFAVVRAPA